MEDRQGHDSQDYYAGSLMDGTYYIEGGGVRDTIFGNQGQDDIIGGSSNLFTLGAVSQRPDLPNMIFGGSGGADIVRSNAGATGTNAHAHVSDAIVANNGNIVRVALTATPQSGFAKFNYDNYAGATERIIPRAISLLDYTPGGPDLLGQAGPVVTGAQSSNGMFDIGAFVLGSGQAQGTEMHGGNGDDFMYGGAGNDVMFGDGQDDTMIAGYGNDWMSGGTGDDGMLGDDGRLLSSREGLTEPLNGLTTARTQAGIATSGNLQQALINVTGELLYIVVLVPDNLDPLHRAPFTLMPRPLYASDIMYGGLGSDAMHGGAGDDAMSGAEAPVTSYTNNYNAAGTTKLNGAPIESDYGRPFNPGNVLGYSTATTKFAQYDANDALRKVLLNASTGALDKTGTGLNWLLNFNAAEGPVDTYWIQGQTTYPGLATDGNDVLFGDLNHDWLVGGTGRDRMYGGWGDDLINEDDNLETNGALNNRTDTNPSYEDLGFGGAGRDVLIANTGGDRLIDWVGEFNTYLVPFSPFGMNMISDQIQPSLPQFLFGLSKSDGADQTLAARYGSATARNGEPFAELGEIEQQDAAYGDQRGNPRDPQAGNLQNQRDVLRTSGTKVIESPGTCCKIGPLMAAVESPSGTGSAASLTADELAPVVAAAKARWFGAGRLTADQVSRLGQVQVGIADLDGLMVGVTAAELVTVDVNAAGWGWFVDPTPMRDEEYRVRGDELVLREGGAATARLDLLSAVLHELGHAIGLEHDTEGLMEPVLGAGVRRVPAPGELGIPTVATWLLPSMTAWEGRQLPLSYRWAPSSSVVGIGAIGRMLGVGDGAQSPARAQSCFSGLAT